MPTRLQIARNDILRVFEAETSRTHRQRDIEKILSMHRESWRLAQDTTVKKFIKYLAESGHLKRLNFDFPQRKEIRYTWGDVPLFAVLMTLKPNCYFCHYTAMKIHDLTEQEPKTIYLSHEQPPKPSPAGGLTQEGIDKAFSRPQRLTNNFTDFDDWRICLLNGKHTGYLGIETLDTGAPDQRISVRVSDLERTLIDIAVRPAYAGGVGEVMKAFRLAGQRSKSDERAVSVNRLAALLKQIGFVYPYHQALGYYMEQCGSFALSAIETFRGKFTLDYNFYLTYGAKNLRFDDRWRIFVPQGM